MLDFVPSHHRSIQVVVYLVSGHMAGLVEGLRILDAVEGFAREAEAAITKSLRSHCLLAVAYDYNYDAVLQNILNPYGYVFLLSLVLRLGPLGVMWVAVVCSSWVASLTRFCFMAAVLQKDFWQCVCKTCKA